MVRRRVGESCGGRRRWTAGLFGLTALLAGPPLARAAPETSTATTTRVLGGLSTDTETDAREPGVYPAPLWWATQLIPSFEVAGGREGTHLGFRWQLTPLAYSWGINRRLSPWRAMVVEPLVRHAGSVEGFVSSGVFVGPDAAAFLRAGARAFFPVVDHGEYVSVSAGAAYQRAWGEHDVVFEVGGYMLYGILGLQVRVAPRPRSPMRASVSLNLRYF